LIGYTATGTTAINSFFDGCEDVLVPDNLCAEVATSLAMQTKLHFAKSIGFQAANYNEKLDNLKPGSGLLFVHSYGDIKYFERNMIWAECEKRHIKFIDDFCLVSPSNFQKYLLKNNSELYLALTSFGYSKVIDLGGGALFSASNKALKHIKFDEKLIYNDHNNKSSNLNYFLKHLENLEINRISRSMGLRKKFSDIFDKQTYCDTDWRFSILVKKNTETYKKLKTKNRYLFWGNNYGELSELSGKFTNSFDSLDYEIFNFFHDFRVEDNYAANIEGYLDCA
jgi:hypothetical protein